MRHLTGSLDVWTSTQVPPLVAHVVDGDRFGLNRIQNLHLKRLPQRLDARSSLLPFFPSRAVSREVGRHRTNTGVLAINRRTP